MEELLKAGEQFHHVETDFCFHRYVSIVEGLAMESPIAQLRWRVRTWALASVTAAGPRSTRWRSAELALTPLSVGTGRWPW